MKAFATAFYNEKASVAAFTNYCIQEEWSIVVSFQKYRCQNRGTLVLKHTAPNCKLRICTFTPSGPFLGIGSGKVIKLNSRNNCLQVLVTKTWIAGCANKIWLIYRLRPLWTLEILPDLKKKSFKNIFLSSVHIFAIFFSFKCLKFTSNNLPKLSLTKIITFTFTGFWREEVLHPSPRHRPIMEHSRPRPLSG